MPTHLTKNSASLNGGEKNIQHQVALWEKSNLSQREFCHQHHLTYYQFQYWRRKFKKNKSRDRNRNFLTVIPRSDTLSTLPPSAYLRSPLAEIFYPDGKRICLYAGLKPAVIRLLTR